MKRIFQASLILTALAFSNHLNAQGELAAIHETLNDYIEGTAFGQPDRLRKAFHPDFNLFLVAEDTLRVIDGEGYINRVEEGKTYNRKARILSVDIENNAASAKIEVYFPEDKRRATDYLLLLKSSEGWKIMHKIINLNAFSSTSELQVENSSEIPAITSTLYDYMDGTANSDMARLNRGFHPDFNLYYVKEGEITTIPGTRYFENFKDGKKFNRIGKILSIDYEDDAGLGKLQILMGERIAIDYLLLLKIKGQWKIIHKSFTTKTYED